MKLKLADCGHYLSEDELEIRDITHLVLEGPRPAVLELRFPRLDSSDIRIDRPFFELFAQYAIEDFDVDSVSHDKPVHVEKVPGAGPLEYRSHFFGRHLFQGKYHDCSVAGV